MNFNIFCFAPQRNLTEPGDPMQTFSCWMDRHERTILARENFGTRLTNFLMRSDDLLGIRITTMDHSHVETEFLFPPWSCLCRYLFNQTYVEV